jgi:hypothetical protein
MFFQTGQLLEQVSPAFSGLNELSPKSINDFLDLTALVSAQLGGELLLRVSHGDDVSLRNKSRLNLPVV